MIEITGKTAVLRTLKDYTHQKNAVWGVMARNRDQNFAFNLLMDPECDFITLTGTAGSGKTLMSLASGLAQVMDDRRYTEIIVTRVTVPVGEDIGFLPGTEEEKMGPWMGALDDNLEVLSKTDSGAGEWGRAATNDLVRSKIKIKSLNFMRGRTFLNKFVIIDEAQNLTPKQMKTLITRAGPGTKIVCLGNLAQIDTPYLTEGSLGPDLRGRPLQGLGPLGPRDPGARRALAARRLRERSALAWGPGSSRAEPHALRFRDPLPGRRRPDALAGRECRLRPAARGPVARARDVSLHQPDRQGDRGRPVPEEEPARAGEVQGSRGLGKVDLILVTHGHTDHIADLSELAALTGATVVANYELASSLVALGLLDGSKTIAMNKGGTVTPLGSSIKIHMVHAEHSSSADLLSLKPDAPGARYVTGGAAVGYVIEFENGFRVYISGDTDVFGDMALINRFFKPDLALVCIGGHFTMDPEHAAYAVRELIKPKQVIPMHWGTLPVINRTPAEFRAALGDAPIKVLDMKPGDTLRF